MAIVNVGGRNYELDLVGHREADARQIAREIAIGVVDIDTILACHGVSDERWQDMATSPRFLQILQEEMATWNSSLNTRERVELKAWAMLEEALPRLWEYLHDPRFADNAKISIIQSLQKQVGIGMKDAQVSDAGQKISITINTGSNEVRVERDVTPKVIEHEHEHEPANT